jgi:KUP system potassium uptake protein
MLRLIGVGYKYLRKLPRAELTTPQFPVISGLKVDLDTTTFYLARETLIPSRKRSGMMLWRDKLFSLMTRNALPATDFFRIPPERVVELGMQIEI